MARALDFVLDQGSTVRRNLTIKDDNNFRVNITGAAIEFHLRERDGSVDVINQAMTITDAPNGDCTLVLTDVQTGALTGGAIYRYEVKMIIAGEITRPIEGRIFVAKKQS